MKIYRILFMTLAVFCGLGSISRIAAQVSTVEIQYTQPAGFTDFNIYGRGPQWSATYFATQVSDYLKPKLERKVPGARLAFKFTEIDLGGQYRTSGRGSGNVRVVTGERHPARMTFAFRLQDSSGRTFASGNTRLVDHSSSRSMMHHPQRTEALFSEKRMLERWLRSIKVS